MNSRIKKICAKLPRYGLDGLLVFSPANISYLVDFASRDSYFLISGKANTYLTDSRYTEEARNSLKGRALVKRIDNSVFKTIVDTCIELGLKRVGFEDRYLSFDAYKKLRKALNKKIDLMPVSGLVEELREIKAPEEIKKIRKATQIAVKALKYIQGFISAGQKEIEIAAELERYIRYEGARASSFDIIVASGPNSSFPHHLTSQRKIRNNEPVLIDMGVEYMGYKSDLTRVFFLGKIDANIKKVYSIVREAQVRAIKKIKPAVLISQIDTAARQYITQEGYGGFFGHNLGHGIGLEVHERPRISGKESGRLKNGMVFTVEPGIYLPNKFGIRIEDTVLITKGKCEVISGSLNK